MQKSDLTELKKTLKSKDKLTISRICTCYVGTDKSIHTRYQSFLNLPDADRYKYENILKKLMSCKAGDTLQTLPFANEESKKALDTVRRSEMKQEEITEALLRKITECFDEMNNYAIFLFYSAYDIPVKGKDKLKQDESEEVYQAIYGVICPMEETEPGLSYYHNDQEFRHRDLDQLVGDPVVGFMYPDFNDRETDDSKYVYGICKPKYPHKELQQGLFGSGSMTTAKDQAQIFNETLAEVFSDNDAEKVAKVSGTVMQKIMEYKTPKPEPEEDDYDEPDIDIDNEDETEDAIEESKKSKKKPVKPAPKKEMDLSLIKEAAIEGGANEEEAENIVTTIKEKAGTNMETVRIDKLPKKSKVKIEDIDITVPADKINRVMTEKRGGKKYVIIELENESSELNINGIICT